MDYFASISLFPSEFSFPLKPDSLLLLLSFCLVFYLFLSFAYRCVMNGTKGETSSMVDARVASIGGDVNFG